MYMPKKENAFYYALRFLQFSHFYPLPKISKKKFCDVPTILFFAAMVIYVIECLLHKIMSNQTSMDTSQDLAVLGCFFNYLYVCCTFKIIVKRYSNLCFQLTDNKYGDPPKMKKMVKISKIGTLTVLIYALISVFCYATAKVFIESVNCNYFNIQMSMHGCNTVAPFWWPFKEINIFWYYVINVTQLLTAEIAAPATGMVITMSWESSQIIKSKIYQLKDYFREVFNSDDPILRRTRLRYCIQYHQHILSITKELNEVNKKVTGQLSFAAAIIMSTLSNQLVKEYSIGAVLHLVGNFLLIALICETGQEIQDETYNIQDAINESNWVKDPKLAKDLLLVLLRCKQPIYMESTLFGAFNYSKLIIIVKTAYSYFTLLSNT